MIVYLYKFNKKPNSTAQPPSEGGLEVEVEIWPPFDMAAPALRCELGMDLLTHYTYATVPLWGKYYFIQSYGWQDGFTLILLKPDPLATYKQFIVAKQQYILRSTENYDLSLIDSFYPTTRNIQTSMLIGSGSPYTTDGGSYIIAVAGEGGARYYQLNPAEFNQLTGWMFGESQETLWDTIVDSTVSSIVRDFLNIYEYILDAVYLPVVKLNIDLAPVKIGYWQTGIEGRVIDLKDHLLYATSNIAVPTNPNATGRKAFLQSQPYVSHVLLVPFCGAIDIPYYASNILVDTEIDYKGNISAKIILDGNTFAIMHGNCASPVYISQNGHSILQMAGDLFQTAGAVISGSIPGAASGAISIVQDMVAHPQAKGSAGSLSDLLVQHIYNILYSTFMDCAPPSDQPPGQVCCKTFAPADTGWYQCADPQIDWVDEMYEMDLTREYMLSGFWIE